MTVGGDLVLARFGAPEYEGTRTLGRPRCAAGGVRRRVGSECPPTVLNTQSKSKSQHFENERNIKNIRITKTSNLILRENVH